MQKQHGNIASTLSERPKSIMEKVRSNGPLVPALKPSSQTKNIWLLLSFQYLSSHNISK